MLLIRYYSKQPVLRTALLNYGDGREISGGSWDGVDEKYGRDQIFIPSRNVLLIASASQPRHTVTVRQGSGASSEGQCLDFSMRCLAFRL